MWGERKVYYDIQKELIQLLPSSNVIDESLMGSIKFYDTIFLKKIMTLHKPKTILEVGSFLGFSSRWFLEVSRSWNAKITSVDPNIPHRIFQEPLAIARKLNERFIAEGRLEIVEAFFGKLIKNPYHYKVYELSGLGGTQATIDGILDSKTIFDAKSGKKFDFIFIDGEHAYDNVKSDLETALQLLNKNGRIIFHDVFSHEGVARLMNEIPFLLGEKAKLRIHGRWIRRRPMRAVKRFFSIFDFIQTDGIGELSLTNIGSHPESVVK